MDWLDRMNSAMDYIELHLTDIIEYEQLAKIVCCSVYHFQRMFSFISGVALSEYIRHRRLTMAATELQNKNTKIIDVALKYGYESPEAFSRAFKNMHGVTPSLAHNMGITLKAYPRMTFYLSIRGGIEMDYRIEQKEAFEVFGVAAEINLNDGKSFIEVPEFWDKCIEDGSMRKINEISGSEGTLCAALFNYHESVCTYMLCRHVPEGGIPDEYTRLHVPALTWAIFPTDAKSEVGTGEQVQNIWKRLYTEWFPNSGYEQDDGPEFEMYYDYGNEHGDWGEVWIPVVKR